MVRILKKPKVHHVTYEKTLTITFFDIDNIITYVIFILDMCKTRNLHQSAYFIGRDLSFRQDREQRLRQELKPATKEPVKKFRFKTKIWFPKNWIMEVSEPASKPISNDKKMHTSVSVLDAAIASGQMDNQNKVIHTY